MANSEVKRGTKDGEEATVPLNLKTSVLRVSIHCEACKRKVEKILKKIQGVEQTEIDQRQQMVTVTGDIDAEILIRKLKKKGRHAEVWPQKPQEPFKAKNKERKSDPNGSKEAQKEKDSVKTEAPAKEQSAKVNSEASGKEASKEKATQDGEPATDRPGAEAKEVKQEEGEENATTSAGDRPAAEKQPVAGESEGGAEKSGGDGSAGKKKKMQGQNGKNANVKGAHSGEGSASSDQSPKPNAANGSRPREQFGQHPIPRRSTDVPVGPRPQYEGEDQGPTLLSPNHAAPRYNPHWYPQPHHPPPAHVFSHHAAPPPYEISYHAADPTNAVSYHTVANPSTSFATSHHALDPPPHPHHSYYMHPDPVMVEERPPYYSNTYHPQSSDSFEYFSDENPNSCSIM